MGNILTMCRGESKRYGSSLMMELTNRLFLLRSKFLLESQSVF